jgi:hypothetical protein
MLVHMAGVFLFWWLLILGVGIFIVLMVEKLVLPSRKNRARSGGPFAALLGQPAPSVPEVEEEEAPAAPSMVSGAPAQPRPLFEGSPLPEPRRYFIGKGPAEDERA